MTNARAITAAQAKAFDQQAIEKLGMPSCVLMENAGRSAAERLLARLRVQSFAGLRPPPPWRVLVLCGRGGNGGDGYVVARHLKNDGQRVEVLSPFTALESSRDNALFRAVCERIGVSVRTSQELAPVELARVGEYDAVVDALLGVGGGGAPRTPIAEWIRRVNGARGPLKLAVDLPSGLDSDQALTAGECFRADFTVTFVARKACTLDPCAAEFTGEVVVADIGVVPPAPG